MPFEALVFKPGNDLEVGNDKGARAFGYAFHIGHMIAVPVRHQNGICLNVIHIYMRG